MGTEAVLPVLVAGDGPDCSMVDVVIDPKLALDHLNDAEATIMSHVAQVSALLPDAPDEDLPDAMPMIMAVLRSISRAAGALEAQEDNT